MSEPTVNQIIREKWRAAIEDGGPVDLKALAPQIAKLLREDADFCALYLEQTLEALVYLVGQRMLIADRRMVRVGTTYATPSDLKATLEQESADASFWDWREYDPTSRLHIRLPEMEKTQVAAAADFHDTQAEHHAFESAFLRFIAGRMQDGQRVQDVWSESALRALRTEIVVSFSFGLTGHDTQITTRKAAPWSSTKQPASSKASGTTAMSSPATASASPSSTA